MTTVCSNRHVVTVDVEPLPVNLNPSRCPTCHPECTCAKAETNVAVDQPSTPTMEIPPPRRRRHPAAHPHFTDGSLNIQDPDAQPEQLGASQSGGDIRPETYHHSNIRERSQPAETDHSAVPKKRPRRKGHSMSAKSDGYVSVPQCAISFG